MKLIARLGAHDKEFPIGCKNKLIISAIIRFRILSVKWHGVVDVEMIFWFLKNQQKELFHNVLNQKLTLPLQSRKNEVINGFFELSTKQLLIRTININYQLWNIKKKPSLIFCWKSNDIFFSSCFPIRDGKYGICMCKMRENLTSHIFEK